MADAQDEPVKKALAQGSPKKSVKRTRDVKEAEAEKEGEKEKEQEQEEYTMRFDHGWTLNDSTFEPWPINKRRKRDVPNPRSTNIDTAHISMNSLSSLQLACNAPITAPAIQLCSRHVMDTWPPEVRSLVSMASPNGPGLWGTSDKTVADMFRQMEEGKNRERRFQVDPSTGVEMYVFYIWLKRRPFVIWPIYVEDEYGFDWVTVFWYAEPNDKGAFDKVVAYSIIDPRRDPLLGPDDKHHPVKTRKRRIRKRLFDIWARARMDTTKARDMGLLSPPIGLEEHDSGERCFAAIKDLGEQLLRYHCTGRQYIPGQTFTHLSPWVCPYKERIEMSGIAAWSLMASFDFNARFSVEAIPAGQRIAVSHNARPAYLLPRDLTGPPYDPFIADPDYLLRKDRHLSRDQQGLFEGQINIK
ncbi:hypothetical protein F5Y17DRAFT_41968 [Xylariaceae sp. FL0594]|nr:hypothetical protein F5Y17DRAFT_41968 [Xylariaceae sp. FL0594]